MAQKADIQELAEWLGGGLADPITLEGYVDDALEAQARAHLWCIDATTVAVTAGQGTYAKQAQMVRVEAVFYDDRHLFNEESKPALDALNSHWRTEVGTPVGYLLDDAEQDDIVVYPAPAHTTSVDMPTDMPFPAPGYLMVVHTTAGPDVPEWATLTLALASLVGEFTHDSPHKDTNFAASANMLHQMLGKVYA